MTTHRSLGGRSKELEEQISTTSTKQKGKLKEARGYTLSKPTPATHFLNLPNMATN